MIKSIFKFFFLHTTPFLVLICSCIFYLGCMAYFYDKELWNHWVVEVRQYAIKEDKSKPLPYKQEQVEQKIYRAKANVLNIREFPSVDSKIIGKIYKNQEVVIFDIENSWGKMQKGYVFLDPKNIQKLDQTYQKPNLEQIAFYKVKVSVANIRKEPLIDSPIIAKAYQGSIIEVQEIDAIWGKTKDGFVALRLLEKVDE